MAESIWHTEEATFPDGTRGTRFVFRNGDTVTYNPHTDTLTVDRRK